MHAHEMIEYPSPEMKESNEDSSFHPVCVVCDSKSETSYKLCCVNGMLLFDSAFDSGSAPSARFMRVRSTPAASDLCV